MLFNISLTSLFWVPDIIICNDWQTSFVPALLKQRFKKEEFYSNMKSIYLIHSLNNYRKFSKSTFDMLNLNTNNMVKEVDGHIKGIESSDLTIVINYEKDKSEAFR